MHNWEGQTERERESQADSFLSAEPNMGLDLMTPKIWTQAKTKSPLLNPLSYPGTPSSIF